MKKPFELLNKLDELPDISAKDKAHIYKYKQSRKKIIASFSLSSVLLDKIERMAYWEHLSKSELVESLLEGYFSNKNFDAIPPKKSIR